MNYVNTQAMQSSVDPGKQTRPKPRNRNRFRVLGFSRRASRSSFPLSNMPSGSVVLAAELPPFAGGWGTSPDLVRYCLYGLAACFAAVLMATASGEGVELSGVKVTVRNWMDLRKQMGLGDGNIMEKIKFSVQAEGAAPDQLEKTAALAKERCPGAECLTRSIPLEVELGI